MRGVAVGKRGGEKEGHYRRTAEGRGEYLAACNRVVTIRDAEIQFSVFQNMDSLQALMQVKALRVENEASSGGPYLHTVRRVSELRSLSISTLKSIQSQLRSDLEEVEKVRTTRDLLFVVASLVGCFLEKLIGDGVLRRM